MNKILEHNNYIVIPNFISQEKAEELGEEYKNYCITNGIANDEQALNSHSSHNYISFLELLCEKTPEISNILEETVLPTYCYSRVYKQGSILKRHTDRDACEISLTLHLNGDRPWPIWIQTPDGKEKFVSLNPGDAMMYLGKIAEHWREEYSGEYYTQVFLHYVRSRGDCSYTYFDILKDKKPQTKVNAVEETKIVESPTKHSPILIKPTSKLEDFVQVFDNMLSEEDCNLILNEYQDSSEWNHTQLGTGDIDKNRRNCMEISISQDYIMEKNFDVRKNIDNVIFEAVKNVITNYNNLVPTFRIDIDTGYQILRYKEGEFYTQHTDSFKQQQRSLSCSIQLNENYDGGEFALFDREMMIRTKPGSVIVFPSNFMYPHEIMPVIKGTRYSIITWLV